MMARCEEHAEDLRNIMVDDDSEAEEGKRDERSVRVLTDAEASALAVEYSSTFSSKLSVCGRVLGHAQLASFAQTLLWERRRTISGST